MSGQSRPPRPPQAETHHTHGPRGADGSVGHSKPGFEFEGEPASGHAPHPHWRETDGTPYDDDSDWRRADSAPERAARHAPWRDASGHSGSQGRAGSKGATSGELVRRRPSQMTRTNSADPMIAGLLSVLLAGGGQIYNRQVGKGVVMFIAWSFMWSFALGWVVNIWAALDAYGTAQNRQGDDA